jgi:hypothetical protein
MAMPVIWHVPGHLLGASLLPRLACFCSFYKPYLGIWESSGPIYFWDFFLFSFIIFTFNYKVDTFSSLCFVFSTICTKNTKNNLFLFSW